MRNGIEVRSSNGFKTFLTQQFIRNAKGLERLRKVLENCQFSGSQRKIDLIKKIQHNGNSSGSTVKMYNSQLLESERKSMKVFEMQKEAVS